MLLIRKKFENWYAQHKFKKKCKELDYKWLMFGGACLGGYPPSFYLKHTPEEIERIQNEDIEKIKEMIKQNKLT